MAEKRLNCWEVKKCGREPGGVNEKELGTCPASTTNEFAGANKGCAAGRFCWVVAGTLCGGFVQGTFASKFKNCLQCPFFLEVEKQEGRFFILNVKKYLEAGFELKSKEDDKGLINAVDEKDQKIEKNDK
ncbi:MAG: hypothetical protein HQM09_01960 [Candidatus Riflebacteria bacterium]|nr:hypothetical protein [Candidatus Riflebacteria bacterium]